MSDFISHTGARRMRGKKIASPKIRTVSRTLALWDISFSSMFGRFQIATFATGVTSDFSSHTASSQHRGGDDIFTKNQRDIQDLSPLVHMVFWHVWTIPESHFGHTSSHWVLVQTASGGKKVGWAMIPWPKIRGASMTLALWQISFHGMFGRFQKATFDLRGHVWI